MIYLDNAATTYPKPHSVYSGILRSMKKRGGNQGRGAHTLSRLASDDVYGLREAASRMFSCGEEEVVVTYNATHALNLAIKGFAKEGCHILISDMEHNSVRRPVISLCEKMGCTYDVYSTFAGDTIKTLAEIKKLTRENTRLIIANHVSNVSNVTLPVVEIGQYCKKRGIKFIVDASQSAGHIPVSFRRIEADAICMPGHKGLYGPQGTGLLLIKNDSNVSTLIEGGAGIDSLDALMPSSFPERLEAGTIPSSLCVGLTEGIKWVESIGIDTIHAYECELSVLLTDYLRNMDGIQLYGEECLTDGPVVLFNICGISPVTVGEILDNAGICTRCGLHCSPLAHEALNTGGSGAVRISFSYFSNYSHVRRLVDDLHNIKKSL